MVLKGSKGKPQLAGHREPGMRKLGAAVFQEEGLARAKGQVDMQNPVLGNGICHGGRGGGVGSCAVITVAQPVLLGRR